MRNQTSPTVVSAKLKRAGFTTVATRNLQGIRVSRGVMGEVSVEVDHDTPGSEKRVADMLHDELKGWAGYNVRRNENHFYVSKADLTPAAPTTDTHDIRKAWQFVVDSYDGWRANYSPTRADWTDAEIFAFVTEHHVTGLDAFKLTPDTPDTADRDELVAIIADHSNLSRGDAQSLAGLIIGAGFTR